MSKNYTKQISIDVSELKKELRSLTQTAKISAEETNKIRLATVSYSDAINKLTNNVNNNKSKEDLLRKALEEVTNSTDANKDAINKATLELEKQITATTKDENTLKEYIEKTEKAKIENDNLKNSFDYLNRVIYDVAKALAEKACKALVDFTKETINTGMQFESAFAGVRKVTSGTEEDFENLEAEIRKTALEKPISADQLASIYQMGSQLGIAKDGLKDFSDAIIDLAKTYDLTEEAGATMIAQYANVTHLPVEEYRKFASTLYYLGSTTATTESTIMDFSSPTRGAR